MTQDRFFSIVASRPEAGRDAAYNDWYNEHVTILFGYPGMSRASRYALYEPVGDTGQMSPAYVTMYEYKTREDMGGVAASDAFAIGGKQFEEGWPGTGIMDWSGAYEPVEVLSRLSDVKTETGPGKGRWLDVVASGPKPGHEAAYNDWYHEHITHLFRYDGLVHVSRNRCSKRIAETEVHSPDYLTVYEFGSQAAADAFYTLPMMKKAAEHWMAHGQAITDVAFAGLYRPLITLER